VNKIIKKRKMLRIFPFSYFSTQLPAPSQSLVHGLVPSSNGSPQELGVHFATQLPGQFE